MAIAATLKILDDKIELNQRMDETLGALAQALFKSWFIDFDPVHAKVGGLHPGALDAAIATLFPTDFVDTDLGRTPQGWRVRSLDKVANYLNGLALQKFPPGDGPTLPVVKIAQLRRGDTAGSDRCNTELPPQYEAQWRATFFLIYPARPPVLGLAFLNEKPARKVFEQWHQRYGQRDEFEELRISIVEGEVQGESPGLHGSRWSRSRQHD